MYWEGENAILEKEDEKSSAENLACLTSNIQMASDRHYLCHFYTKKHVKKFVEMPSLKYMLPLLGALAPAMA